MTSSPIRLEAHDLAAGEDVAAAAQDGPSAITRFRRSETAAGRGQPRSRSRSASSRASATSARALAPVGAQGRAAPGRHEPCSSTSSRRRRASSPARSTPGRFRCWRRSWPRTRGTSTRLCSLATAHSALGHDRQAIEAFEKAAEIAPDSQDVRTYLALHYARGKQWERAVPLLERVVAETPDRLPALEALAVVRERQGRIPRGGRAAPEDLWHAQAHADGARPARDNWP